MTDPAQRAEPVKIIAPLSIKMWEQVQNFNHNVEHVFFLWEDEEKKLFLEEEKI